jgi:hypothetical protein
MRIGASLLVVRARAAGVVALVASVGAATAGCTRSLSQPKYSAQPTSALTVVDVPPPPGRVEAIPDAPAGAVWVDGEWTWRRARWAWSPGRWVVAPSGATFSPWAFVRGPDGTLWYAPGTWRDAKGAVLEAPEAVSMAQPSVVDVVNASGNVESTGPTLRSRSRSGR